MIELTEVWKDISGFEGLYQISNLGRVKSLGRTRIRSGSCKVPRSTIRWNYKSKILKPIKMNGYIKVNLHSLGSDQHQFLISHLVANAFILPKYTRITRICYKDNDYSNCSVDNLIVQYIPDDN